MNLIALFFILRNITPWGLTHHIDLNSQSMGATKELITLSNKQILEHGHKESQIERIREFDTTHSISTSYDSTRTGKTVKIFQEINYIHSHDQNNPTFEDIWLNFGHLILEASISISVTALIFVSVRNRILDKEVKQRRRAESQLKASEQRFRLAINKAPYPIIIYAEDGEILQVNTAWIETTGYSQRQTPTLKVWTDSVSIIRGSEKSSKERGEILLESFPHDNEEYIIHTEAGEKRIWYFKSASLGELLEGRKAIISVATDITEQKNLDIALYESEENLRLVTENMTDLVCLHELDGNYIYLTPSIQSLLGYTSEELVGRHPSTLFHPEDDKFARLKYKNSTSRAESAPFTYRVLRKSGEYIWLETILRVIRDHEGNPVRLQSNSRDVSDRVRAESQLKYDALHDRLTGLANRSLLIERIQYSMVRAKRNPDFQYALLFLDLDNFKVVNDSLGHTTGDELLTSIAKILKNLIRESDLAVRLGGDEFVLLLEDSINLAQVVTVAERILAALVSPIHLSDTEVFASASIGLVMGSPEYKSPEELIRDSDLAMYRAKQAGKGQYSIFNPDMHQEMILRLERERDLRKALERQEFVLHYQPIFCLGQELIRGVEGLIRWQHPEHGLMPPDDFIGLAEDMGLIVPIGEWVLQESCRQLALWQEQFPNLSLGVSVNLSVKQLQPFLLEHVSRAVESSGIEASSLTLEITESMLVNQFEEARSLLEKIKGTGIQISIDDFGTGYSSLSYLYRLPVDYLKIDKSFVGLEIGESRNRLIAESVIALSDLLGIRAVAEGIETTPQLDWLKKHGCELGQGYLFSRPLNVEEMTDYLRKLTSPLAAHV